MGLSAPTSRCPANCYLRWQSLESSSKGLSSARDLGPLPLPLIRGCPWGAALPILSLWLYLFQPCSFVHHLQGLKSTVDSRVTGAHGDRSMPDKCK